MASRKEEKERLRREREELERKHRAEETRRKRIATALGAVLAVAVIAVVVFAVTSGGDDENAEPTQPTSAEARIPARQTEDLDEAARAAGCEVEQHPDEGRGHTSAPVTYKTNPPTSGAHADFDSQVGVYEEPPKVEETVHALEHGRVNIQYKPGTPPPRVAQLETLLNEKLRNQAGYGTLLFENQTNMPYAVAATMWRRSITCPSWNDKIFDALRAFREKATVGEWQSEAPEAELR
ncbi:MAG TPA: DUF3105 domain-containing protein [Solirubrobacteraceae bacterium]|nr:DUF3105 domain-containing protein [Solirubrobacteraceae bacterium]